jgi:hypothetical protein
MVGVLVAGGHLQGENTEELLAVALGRVGGQVEEDEIVRGPPTKSSAGVPE